MKEYKTTIESYGTQGKRPGGDYEDAWADDPIPPDDAERGSVHRNWRLAGMTAADGILFFAWERDK